MCKITFSVRSGKRSNINLFPFRIDLVIEYIALPSKPFFVITASPRDTTLPELKAMFFKGLPKCASTFFDQETNKPILADLSSSISTPSFSNTSTHKPLDPRRFQLPPPKHKTVTEGLMRVGPSGVSKHNSSPFHPVQFQPVLKLTPSSFSLMIHERKIGDAFIATGKTRPLEPTNKSSFKPSAHLITSLGQKLFNIGSSHSEAS